MPPRGVCAVGVMGCVAIPSASSESQAAHAFVGVDIDIENGQIRALARHKGRHRVGPHAPPFCIVSRFVVPSFRPCGVNGTLFRVGMTCQPRWV